MKLLLEDIYPSSSINIELHSQEIQNSKLQDFKGNVSEMLKSTEHHFQVIVGNGHTYDSETYRLHLLASLLTGYNAEFNTNIQSIKSNLEAGCGYSSSITTNFLITSAKQLYTNIDTRKAWDKVDPRDAHIMALTTALKNATPNTTTRTSTKFNTNNDPTVPGMNTLELWRTIKKGDTVDKHGKICNWCTHHKSGKFGYDGLYYHNHTNDSNDEWRSIKKSKTEAFTTPSGLSG